MTRIDWENITNYIESVGTTDTVFPFVKAQSSVKVTSSGANDNIIYTIGGQSGTLLPGQSVTVIGTISSMTLRSASGRQPFQVWATEAGTEKDETDTSYQGQIDGLTTQLAQIGQQKADTTYVDNKFAGAVNGSPIPVTLSSQMTDHTRNYVYLGTESGYTAGNLYYWNGTAFVDSGKQYQSTGIADKSILARQLASNSTPVIKLATNYTLVSNQTTLYIPNIPLSEGLINVTFFANSAASGYLYLLEKVSGTTNFNVIDKVAISSVVGENNINTPFITKGNGNEYIGIIGIAAKFSSTGGNGYYSKDSYDNTTTPFAGNDSTTGTVDFGLYVTYSNVKIVDKMNQYDLNIVSDTSIPSTKTLSTYTQASQGGNIYIPNAPLASGYLSVILQASATSGYLYVLEKDPSSLNFTVKYKTSFTTVVGQNTLDSNYLCSGNGNEYVGFSGFQVNFKNTGGPGFYQIAENNSYGTNSVFTATSNVGTPFDFGYYLKYTNLVKSQLVQTIKTIQNNITTLNNSVIPDQIAPFDLLRFQPTTGNFANYPNAYFFGRWFNKTVNAVNYVASVYQGAEIYAKVSGTTTVTAVMKDISSTGNTPYISVSVDGGAFTRYLVADQVTIATGLTTDDHYIRIIVSGVNANDVMWTQGQGVCFNSLTVDAGGTVTPIKPYNRYGVFFGDSITEGINVLGSGSNPTVNCGEKAYAFIASQQLNVACIRVGIGGTGITQGGNGGFPKALDYVDYNISGVKEMADLPDFVVVNHGTNDSGADSPTFTSGYTTYIQKLQKKYPGVPIFAMRPFNGTHGTDVKNVVATFKNVFYVDTTNWGITYSDGTHPDTNGGQTAGQKLASAIKSILGFSYFLK